jgi:uncharacterized membrane protein
MPLLGTLVNLQVALGELLAVLQAALEYGVGPGASPGELARARAAYEGVWNFWNGVRTVFSILAFLALVGACLLREDRGT